MSTNGTDLTLKPVTEMARSAFDEAQVHLIRDTVAKGCTIPELHMFLELAARYRLDPFAKQIWAAKMRGENGPVSILVGRDGYLAIAERHEHYEGMDGDVVREGDTFKVLRKDGTIEVDHQYGDERGAVKGAWCIVWRSDRSRPTYFWAPVDDYRPTGNKLEKSPWGKQESVMMLKCAQSTALRLAFNVSGFVPAEEAGWYEGEKVRDGAPVVTDDEIEWGEDEALEKRLRAAFDAANSIRPNSFLPAKIKLLLAGKSPEERERVAVEVEGWVTEHGGTVPQPEVVDAEPVVEEPSAA